MAKTTTAAPNRPAIGIFLCLTLAALCAPSRAAAECTWRLTKEKSIERYTVQHSICVTRADPSTNTKWDSKEKVVILRDGAEIETIDGRSVGVALSEDETRYVPLAGTRIMGGTLPNLVVYAFGWPETCCYLTYIYELGATLRKLDMLNAVHDPVLFLQLDNDPALEAITSETYFYQTWEGDHFGRIDPEIVLKYDAKRGHYRIAASWMRRPPPPDPDLRRWARSSQASYAWSNPKYAALRAMGTGRDYPGDLLPRVMVGTIVDLIYTGQARLARRFLDMAWLPGQPGKLEFWTFFTQCELPSTRYWPDIAAMNRLPATKPAGDCIPKRKQRR